LELVWSACYARIESGAGAHGALGLKVRIEPHSDLSMSEIP